MNIFSVFTYSFTDDYTFTVKFFSSDTVIPPTWTSRDLFLYGDIGEGGSIPSWIEAGRTVGDFWLIAHPGYAICDKTGQQHTATYILRGDDNISGNPTTNDDGSTSAQNVPVKARWTYTFIKDNDDRTSEWKVKDFVAQVNPHFGRFNIVNGMPQ